MRAKAERIDEDLLPMSWTVVFFDEWKANMTTRLASTNGRPKRADFH